MADHTAIEWTDATWNPITGCSVVSPGCTNCYAMRLAGGRLKHVASRQGLTIESKAGPVWNGQVRLNADQLTLPLRWKRPRRIFVCAHGDLFHESVPDAWIDQVFAVMALSPQHTFQVLTKRTGRMAAYLGTPGRPETRARFDAIKTVIETKHGKPMPASFWFMQHIWLGFSAEDQLRFAARWSELCEASGFGPRFVSIEPMLGPIDLGFQTDHCDLCGGTGILARWPKGKCHVCAGKGRVWINGARRRDGYHRLDWVIAGGESGPGARPMHPDWARQLRDQCASAGVPFFFKQWGAWAPGENAGPVRGPQTGAWLDDAGWSYSAFTRAGADGLTADDEPDVWSVGKKAGGRLLDGVEHNAMPGVPA